MPQRFGEWSSLQTMLSRGGGRILVGMHCRPDQARPADAVFLPAVHEWFTRALGTPTVAQREAWPAIQAGQDVLVAAPTGSGKTLAAFLAAIDRLIRQGQQQILADACQVLYVSPLKALSNDIQKNLQLPLNGIADSLLERGELPVAVRAMVRTGDTSQSERERMRRTPPQILVTTPESLFILLGSDSGRVMLGSVETVIVDEIHALAGNKRGAHLALSLARLDALCGRRPQRIGLSATQKPIARVAEYLSAGHPCHIVDTGHARERDLSLVVPGSPLTAVMANEVWAEVYDQLATLARSHSTTLVFVNTRRLAERATRHLAERLGEEHVAAHHGSMSKEHRLAAEQKLKAGDLRALVATASLELGIDIGDVDLVCQIGSPRGIGAFLQRVGRSGHAVGATPKGRLLPTTLDELVESAALLDAVARGELDSLQIVRPALDVLAQHLVAEVAAREWDETQLYKQMILAWPYRDLSRDKFSQVVKMLAEGYTTRRGRRGAYLHRDAVNGRLRARRGARLVALTNAGVIPDQFDYDVVLAPQGLKIGSIGEDFGFESMPGDIFQLGNQSYRILKVESGRVLVEDARGLPPTIPFWVGEAPGRTDELSLAVSRLREEVGRRLETGVPATAQWLTQQHRIPPAAAEQLSEYLAAGQAALGCLPSVTRIVLERFFDETGDMHLVVHSPFGSRINRAWGLSLRKRFCRKFNFELQAAALEDSIVLSLGVTHSFPLAEVAHYLNAATVRPLLIQALLDAPLFPTRWRWNASTALAVRRHLGNRRAPPVWQRNDAEDLMAVVFPDQIACAENLSGPREIPDHPLVEQTLDDCLFEALDIEGLERVLAGLESGAIAVVSVELTAPSPLAQEVLNARPYAFLDDGDAENRRTMAVGRQPQLSVAAAGQLRHLDAAAIARVCEQAWPGPRDADEMHDALVIHGYFTAAECAKHGWQVWLDELAAQGRAACATVGRGPSLWLATERLPEFLALVPELETRPQLQALSEPPDPARALVELVRGRLEAVGPTTIDRLAASLGLDAASIAQAMLALEGEGFAVRGQFNAALEQWCERRLLARIHRDSVDRLRAETRPVSVRDYLRFLLDWQGLTGDRPEGEQALLTALDRLEGFSAPAAAWEAELLPARIGLFQPSQLDGLCAAGKVAWSRLSPRRAGSKGGGPVKNTPIAFVPRENIALWRGLVKKSAADDLALSSAAGQVLEALRAAGASFFSDIADQTGLLRAQVEDALGELVAQGLVAADTFGGLRSLISPVSRKPRQAPRTRRRRPLFSGVQDAGRWSLIGQPAVNEADALEHYAWAILTRYGVLVRKLLEREAIAPNWRQLLRVLWRLEARGEIRGGRFIDGIAGEQFALPEAVDALRAIRRRAGSLRDVVVAGADPANLVGLLLPGARVSATPGNRIVYRDGLAVAFLVNGEFRYVPELDVVAQAQMRAVLTASSAPRRRRS